MPMKHITLFIAIGIAANGNAQLLNGSFENALGQGDLSNWDHACIAQSSAGGAPLSGNWNAEVEASKFETATPASVPALTVAAVPNRGPRSDWTSGP